MLEEKKSGNNQTGANKPGETRPPITTPKPSTIPMKPAQNISNTIRPTPKPVITSQNAAKPAINAAKPTVNAAKPTVNTSKPASNISGIAKSASNIPKPISIPVKPSASIPSPESGFVIDATPEEGIVPENGFVIDATPEEGMVIDATPESGFVIDATPEEAIIIDATPENGFVIDAIPEEGISIGTPQEGIVITNPESPKNSLPSSLPKTKTNQSNEKTSGIEKSESTHKTSGITSSPKVIAQNKAETPKAITQNKAETPKAVAQNKAETPKAITQNKAEVTTHNKSSIQSKSEISRSSNKVTPQRKATTSKLKSASSLAEQKEKRKERRSAAFEKYKTKSLENAEKKSSTAKSSKRPLRMLWKIKESHITWVILGIGIVLMVAFIYSYISNENTRLLEQLQNFPTEISQDFQPRNHPVIRDLIYKGQKIVPWILKNYPNFNLSQKSAVILALGEIKDPSSLNLLAQVVEDESENLAKISLQSLAKMKESAVPSLIEKVKTAKQRRKYFLEALANTQQASAFDTILAACNDGDWKIRETAIRGLVYYGNEKGTISQLLNSLSDPQIGVAEAALVTLEELQQSQKLTAQAEMLNTQLMTLFTTKKETQSRSYFLRAMGITGLCLKPDGDNYVGKLLPLVREAFREGSELEKISAAFALGKFQDSEMLEELLESFDQDVPEMTYSIASALQNLNLQTIPQEMLNKKFSNRSHVQIALAQTYLKYHTYILKLELQNSAIIKILEMWQYAKPNAMESLAISLGRFCKEPILYLLWTKEDFKDLPSLITKLKNRSDPLSKITDIFEQSTQDLLAKFDGKSSISSELQMALVNEFNRLLCKENLATLIGAEKIAQNFEPTWGAIDSSKRVIWNRAILEQFCSKDLWRTNLLFPSDLKDAKSFLEKIRPTSAIELSENQPEEMATVEIPSTPNTPPPPKTKDTRNSLGRFLWNDLTSETQQIIFNHDTKNPPKTSLIWLLIEEWNETMAKGIIYQPNYMNDYTLSQEFLNWPTKNSTEIAKNPRALIWYNRWFLQEVFGKDIEIVESYFKK